MDSNPEKRIRDIVEGRVALDNITMSEWMQLNLMQMVEKERPHLNIVLPFGGRMYLVHHYIDDVKPPFIQQQEEPLIGEYK